MELHSLPSSPRRRTPLEIERAVIFALVVRELRSRVGGHWLGLLWMVFEPLGHVLAMLALLSFTQATAHPGIELPVYLVTGLMPFFMFRNVVRRVPQALAASRGLFAYRQVHPFDALVARAVVEIGLYSAVYLVALALLGWLGFRWLPEFPLELLGVSVVLLALGLGLGFSLAVAGHGRPRVDTVVGLLFFPLYIGSGVVFQLHRFPPETRDWLLWNPVLHLIELSRSYFIPEYIPLEGANLAYPAAWALAICALGISLYRVYRHRLLGA